MKLKSSLLALFLLLGALSLRADFNECAAQCELQFARDAANCQTSLWDDLMTGLGDTMQTAFDTFQTGMSALSGDYASTLQGCCSLANDINQNQEDAQNTQDLGIEYGEFVAQFFTCIADCKIE